VAEPVERTGSGAIGAALQVVTFARHSTMAPHAKGRVLVVEDCAEVRHIWQRVLASAGYEVVEAADALDGISKAQTVEPDVVLMDVWMPGLNGIAAVARLRDHDATANLPVIAVSGDLLVADRARAAGFDAFLLKPVRPAQLLDAIAQLLESRRSVRRQRSE
jgi:two-component system cell cycle response regulator DivK